MVSWTVPSADSTRSAVTLVIATVSTFGEKATRPEKRDLSESNEILVSDMSVPFEKDGEKKWW